jgi:hypothetical protein
VPEPFPFRELGSQLDEIDSWLRSLGYAEYDRIRKYRANIRHMIEMEARGDFASLQDMSVGKSREVFWSYVEADEFVRAVLPLRRFVVRRDGYFTEIKSRTWLFCLKCALQRKRGEPSFRSFINHCFPKYQSRLTIKL